MRVYIAAPWVRKDAAQEAAAKFEAAGHTITKKWWEHREVPGYLRDDISNEELAELQVQAAEDMEGVLTADAFILLNLEKSEGKAVETGFAIAGNCILILVGQKSNLFHYDPLFDQYATVEQAVARLTLDSDPAFND